MNSKSLTYAVALDCEMVGAGPGGRISMVARVSVVNEYFCCLYDKYVQPRKPVTDYRTNVSGIQPHHLISNNAVPLRTVQKEVAALLKGGILVGHAVEKDLKVLGLCHPEDMIRDTAYYHAFQTVYKQFEDEWEESEEETGDVDSYYDDDYDYCNY